MRFIKFLLFIIALITINANFAYAKNDAKSEAFNKFYGGNSSDSTYAVQQTNDGGYILAGSTSSFGTSYNGDVLLIKTDAKGKQIWLRTFGGSEMDLAFSVQQTSDNGYIVAGQTQSYGEGYGDGWLIKIDAKGNNVWDTTFGGTGSDVLNDVQETSDGGYILAGYTESVADGGNYEGGKAWLIKTDRKGKKIWEKTYAGKSSGIYQHKNANAVQQTSDGGYIMAGYTTVAHPSGTWADDAWLIKTDAKGKTIWNITFGGTGEDINDYAQDVQQTQDGGYIVAGRTNAFSVAEPDTMATDKAWLVKIDTRGKKIWEKTYGGNKNDSANAVQQTEDGGYILAGKTFSFAENGEADLWLIKTDDKGKEVWDKTFGGSTGFSEAYDVQQTSDGGYIVAGFSWTGDINGEDAWLIKTDAKGKVRK
jgi:hypothetical protein